MFNVPGLTPEALIFSVPAPSLCRLSAATPLTCQSTNDSAFTVMPPPRQVWVSFGMTV
ncbi:hypothetical protein LMG7053_05307 [Achromobacter ruhlandii]|uniref:Uncharacterized protein n=1 Tax=Achromobacter ruhlandii TaxID=72557 RepID=A0ABM8M321_9BURK|nr:hypothetical protein LMG1864_05481 [Achromobacter ruhlandii]CAB3957504.1 hypothetical protein LMG7053_05307 [Achromobacter ruhlandii]